MEKAAAELSIQPFQPADQAEVKALILSGLVDHWGFLDPALNPDLNDIASTYASPAVFLVARQFGRVVAAGALVPRGEDCAEVVRMSVAHNLRRQGIGQLLLSRLIEQARAAGFQRVVLETTTTWSEVVAFYLRAGFHITHHCDGDTYFELILP